MKAECALCGDQLKGTEVKREDYPMVCFKCIKRHAPCECCNDMMPLGGLKKVGHMKVCEECVAYAHQMARVW